MRPFVRVVGRAAPLDRSDVDTDQIIPARHLKRIERSGYGAFLFEAWRKDPLFALNRPEHEGAEVLLTGANFGCGSSREHAVWALTDGGFRVVIAASFADIFANNAAQNGLLALKLPAEVVSALIQCCQEQPATELSVDLESQTVTWRAGSHTFEIDAEVRSSLLAGRDAIANTLVKEAAISAYESRRTSLLPTLRPPTA